MPAFRNVLSFQKSKIIHFFGYCLFLFLTLEIIARLAFLNPEIFKLLERGEYISDSVWRLTWINQCREKKKGKIHFTYDLPDSTRGWRLKPNLKDANENGRLLNTNSKGIRGLQEYDYQKPPGQNPHSRVR